MMQRMVPLKKRALVWLLFLLFSGAVAMLHADEAELEVAVQNGLPRMQSADFTGNRLRLEHSQDLLSWNETAQVSGLLHDYGDWFRSGRAQGYYRLHISPATAADDWSNQIAATATALWKPGTGSGLAATAYAKCALLLIHPDRVYFQDSVKYPFHLQFARARLPGYANMSALEFNAQALYANAAQRMVLGSVLRAPDPQVRELGIEITGAGAFPAVQAAEWCEAISRRLMTEDGWRVFYMPSTEQRDETEANLPVFEARGIEVSSLNRWATANACYSAGWALGRMVYVPASQISDALADGRLKFDDILVTDRVPAELPVLAGYLCLEPATPNSHVALLARSMLLPFAYANGAGLQAEIASLHGREVLLIVEESETGCRISLRDTTDILTPERRQEILESKRGGPLEFTPKATRGAFTVSTDPLTPEDIRYAGGKAAHFGFLRRALPDDSPHPALAVTFDLWDAYLAQPYGGGTLGQFISSRMAAHTYPPRVAELRADLAVIRSIIEDTTDFTPSQRTAVIAALVNAGLQGAKIRFRSSTNVEDSETFSGAGLYDSYSGCLEDDLDGDDEGPSHCDPDESKERGVFRAMRRVYASFYNENAVVERLRHGVDESKVGMAMLVHFSSPDEFEMANGVTTLAVEKSTGRTARARIVSQLGAESVTNPDSSVRAEVVSALFTGTSAAAAEFTLDEPSSLTPEGAPVMRWLEDYRTLLTQMNTAALAWEAYYPARSSYELDFEFKRLQPGHVGLKQMRPVPHPVPVPPPVIP
jgi:hypothetical protein